MITKKKSVNFSHPFINETDIKCILTSLVENDKLAHVSFRIGHLFSEASYKLRKLFNIKNGYPT